MILRRGPPAIGQKRVRLLLPHAIFAFRELASNRSWSTRIPKTAKATDYEPAICVFEPLTTEDVLNICDRVQPDGVIVQFGGANAAESGRGLSSNAAFPHRHQRRYDIAMAEYREKFHAAQPVGSETSLPTASARTNGPPAPRLPRSAFPIWLRPIFVLAACEMPLLTTRHSSKIRGRGLCRVSGSSRVDRRFLEDAIESDVTP